MRRVETKWRGRSDNYALMSSGEIPEQISKRPGVLTKFNSSSSWIGDSVPEIVRKAEIGDNDLVAESEIFLSQLEDQVPMSRGWRNIDDVVGAVPNVPAFLAGHPQCMRRRQRVARDSAPIAIFMDLTSSGDIRARDVQRRGTVLLALVRLLVEHRPVELWCGASLDSDGNGAGTVAWRIDTTPLDLARAAYHIGATAMSRGFGYGMIRHVFGSSSRWPFGSFGLHVETAPDRLRPVLDVGELLYVPPIYSDDPMTADPVGWIRRNLAEYIGQEES